MKFVNWLGLGALAMSGVAVAGPYVGGAGTFSQYEYEDVDDATSFAAFAGYRFDQVPLMLEVAYTDAGKHDIRGLPSGVGLKFSGVRGSLGYFAKLDSKGSGVWLKGGYYDGDADLELTNTPFADRSASSSGFTYGLGGDWKLTPWFGLRFDLENYVDVRDFSDFPDSDAGESNVTVISLGVVLELPSGTSRLPSSYAPAPAPAYQPAYPPAAAPAPVVPAIQSQPPHPATAAPTSIPAASQPTSASSTIKPDLPGGMVAAGVRLTAQPTMLLRQPRSGAPIDGSIPAGAELQLLQRVPNAQGVWWYASYNGMSGWVSESALK
ncbi:hypothetical protein C3942_04530 [Solimonas fluminis]|uniref:Outer membrane protein beta-barrel domain-containing protein n=1 Tax=Solimonas fluminis TaxID=2086571 RepID=A0A2S5TJ18_9GAMM|nr:outer membrane beta-barrel protein [Solimonas fluminis]PPE74947.1 hypothetical protein C3942_04530 [Solimonas fluminis]